jgi:hypothetical protein
MLILLPIIILSFTALTALFLRFFLPRFKYHWILAAGGATLGFASVILWQIQFPNQITFPSWQLVPGFHSVPDWVADDVSWPYALALATLTAAVIWTSIVRAETELMPLVETLILGAFGILSAAAGNPLTLLLSWSAIDLFELFVTLRSSQGESQTERVISAFSARLAGTGLVMWANFISAGAGNPLDFRSTQNSFGIYILIAIGLRLGVLTMHPLYHKNTSVQRGLGTAIRLVSAGASLVLLARITTASPQSILAPILLTVVAIGALYAGWKWLRSSDEITGQPFWILGMASLAIAENLNGNPTGSTGWGVGMIMGGGILFLFSARNKKILWLPLLGLWVVSTLPFSITASSWKTGGSISWLFLIPLCCAQAFLLAGLFRHLIRPGETSLETQEKWIKVIYPAGLLILALSALILGLWGWAGALTVGLWWLATVVCLVAAGCYFLTRRNLIRIPLENNTVQWIRIFQIQRPYRMVAIIYNHMRSVVDAITAALEGEGGLLWSLLLLVLIFSVISTLGS